MAPRLEMDTVEEAGFVWILVTPVLVALAEGMVLMVHVNGAHEEVMVLERICQGSN